MMVEAAAGASVLIFLSAQPYLTSPRRTGGEGGAVDISM